MKILPDHNTPHGLRHALEDHEVQTAEHLGWETLRNGDLIRSAVQEGFDLLIACVQSIRFQQNLLRQPITVVTIATNDWNTIRANLSQVRSAIDIARRGENNLLRLALPP